MANRLTSEGLTVGSSTLTNIVRDWGGGSIFCGFSDNPTFTEVSITADYSLPSINVGEVKLVLVRGPSSSLAKVCLPSGGRYICISNPLLATSTETFLLTPSFGFAYYIDTNGKTNYIVPRMYGGGVQVAEAGTYAIYESTFISVPSIVYFRIS